MPALSDRRGDVPALAAAMLDRPAGASEGAGARFSDEAAERLARLDVPGNLPQLRALVLRASLLAPDPGVIGVADLEAALAVDALPAPRSSGSELWDRLAPEFAAGRLTLDSYNAHLLHAALGQCGGNVAAAARLLGLSRAQMAYRLGHSPRP